MEEKNNQKPRPHTYESLAFFGAVTASVSHELNNVLAIMDQTTGLLEDRLTTKSDDIHFPSTKLEKVVNSLQHQAQRGLDLIKRLNRFAHSADVPELTFEVNQTLDNLVQLTCRLARLKGAGLEIQPFQEPLNINSNPFILQQVVFAAIMRALQEARKGDIIVVSVNRRDGRVEIEIKGPSTVDSQASIEIGDIRRALEMLSGSLNWEMSDRILTIRVMIPE